MVGLIKGVAQKTVLGGPLLENLNAVGFSEKNTFFFKFAFPP